MRSFCAGCDCRNNCHHRLPRVATSATLTFLMAEYSEGYERTITFDSLADWHDSLQGAFADPDDRQSSLRAQRQQLRQAIAGAGQVMNADSLETYRRMLECLWFDAHSQLLPEGVGHYSIGREDDRGDLDFDDDK